MTDKTTDKNSNGSDKKIAIDKMINNVFFATNFHINSLANFLTLSFLMSFQFFLFRPQ